MLFFSLLFRRYLIKFLAKLAQTSDINKMTPSNIAIVLGPNLLWAKNEGWVTVPCILLSKFCFSPDGKGRHEIHFWSRSFPDSQLSQTLLCAGSCPTCWSHKGVRDFVPILQRPQSWAARQVNGDRAVISSTHTSLHPRRYEGGTQLGLSHSGGDGTWLMMDEWFSMGRTWMSRGTEGIKRPWSLCLGVRGGVHHVVSYSLSTGVMRLWVKFMEPLYEGPHASCWDVSNLFYGSCWEEGIKISQQKNHLSKLDLERLFVGSENCRLTRGEVSKRSTRKRLGNHSCWRLPHNLLKLVICPHFYRWGCWGLERTNNLLIAQQGSGGAHRICP